MIEDRLTKDEIKKMLEGASIEKEDLIRLLTIDTKEDIKTLQKLALDIKKENIGRIVHFRGLIEFSNNCSKNCYYCGLRKQNKKVSRYLLSEDEIVEAARFADETRYGSIVLQSGENQSKAFIEFVCHVVKKIKSRYNLGVTLSCGEQTRETYQRFFDSGAHRYLLRIETSSPELYSKIHPSDKNHQFKTRLDCLINLQKIGFQLGSGSMVGVPGQTYEDVANDILFFRDLDVEMVGIGPFIEHSETPFFQHTNYPNPVADRFIITLKMIAILRIMMKDINLASTTAMQALDKMGREKGLLFGANIIMPNLTPTAYRKDYLLYEDKPCLDENAVQCNKCLEMRIGLTGETIGYGTWGDPLHFFHRAN